MFSWLLRLMRRALSFWPASVSPVQLALQGISAPAGSIKRPWRGPDRPSADPRSSVREPKPDRPSDWSGAVAVVEPDESDTLTAVATDPGGRRHKPLLDSYEG
jgi:hypothetical protein